ncbi:MAG: type I secretion system permease/ATPase [Desulfovibrionaceae bacterium]|nr:type I secretion system permease/ATPase [Desulfovibrionaceae bacterium]
MSDAAKAAAAVEAAKAATKAAMEAASTRPNEARARLAERWTPMLELAAQYLGASISGEALRRSFAWSQEGDEEEMVAAAVQSAGLAAQFVDAGQSAFDAAYLPALARLGSQVALVTELDEETARFTLLADGHRSEHNLPRDVFNKELEGRLLVMNEAIERHYRRVDDYLKLKSKSWLRQLFADNWSVLFELGAASLVGNLLAVGTSLFAMQVWDRVVPARSTNTLWVLALGVAIALMFDFLLRMSRVSLADRFGKQADLKLSAWFFERALDIRNDVRPRSPGSLIAQLRDLEQVRELLTSTTLGTLIDLPFVATFLLIMWLIGGDLALVPLVAVPLVIVPCLLVQIPLKKLTEANLTESALRNTILIESVHRIEDIKLLQVERRYTKLWNRVNEAASTVSIKQRFYGAILVNYSQTIQQLAYVGVVIAGVYGIIANQLSFGAVLACSILTSRTIAPLAQIASVFGRLQSARVSKTGLDRLLSLPVDHDPEVDVYHRPRLAGGYRFEQAIYGYEPDRPPALMIGALEIAPGEKVGVLGKVGAGKSTLLKVAAGLSRPVQGQVLMDGTPMTTIDVSDLRRDIGFLSQESSLFHGSLRENLLLANPWASDEEMMAALKLACADHLLLNQQQGLDRPIREEGRGLSGGQRQALMLARTFLRNPQVLLLDEPTASLDEGTEMNVVANLKRWMGQRTLIVATHRPALLALVDRLIVIDNGRIVLDGPKDKVIARLSQPAGVKVSVSPPPAADQAAPQVQGGQA